MSGITTKELDIIAEKEIFKYNVIHAFKGYDKIFTTICTSVNDRFVYGNSGRYVLKNRDIISIDIDVTKESFFEGLKYCKVRYILSDVSHAIQSYVEGKGFSIVRDYVGYGLKTEIHKNSEIPNYGRSGCGLRLAKGMILAIKSMVNKETYDIKTLLQSLMMNLCYNMHRKRGVI